MLLFAILVYLVSDPDRRIRLLLNLVFAHANSIFAQSLRAALLRFRLVQLPATDIARFSRFIKLCCILDFFHILGHGKHRNETCFHQAQWRYLRICEDQRYWKFRSSLQSGRDGDSRGRGDQESAPRQALQGTHPNAYFLRVSILQTGPRHSSRLGFQCA